jgi:hypothetical protein
MEGLLSEEGHIVILMLVEELKHVAQSVKLATCCNVVLTCRMLGALLPHTLYVSMKH